MIIRCLTLRQSVLKIEKLFEAAIERAAFKKLRNNLREETKHNDSMSERSNLQSAFGVVDVGRKKTQKGEDRISTVRSGDQDRHTDSSVEEEQYQDSAIKARIVETYGDI